MMTVKTLQRAALWGGPLFFAACCLADFGLERPAQVALGITGWVALWWIVEPVPMAATSLLPMVLFPLTGLLPLKTVAAEYSNEIVYLFMAGFILGKAIEKHGLHRRIALTLVAAMGSSPQRVLLGFMVATAAISMWISNTATAMMMLPVALAVSGHDGEATPESSSNFSKNLMLGVGYAASIGGMATVIGTPTNAIFVSFAKQSFPDRAVGFGEWLAFGLPYAALLLLFCWKMLLWVFPLKKEEASHDREAVRRELLFLGKMTAAEKRVLLVFLLVVGGWVSGAFIWYGWFDKALGVGDTTVALVGAMLLFLIKSGPASDEKLMDWKTAERIPWGILLLFGGGLAIAKGFDVSGLARWMGGQLAGLGGLPLAVVLFAVLAVTVALSEVASNIATASMMMPVLASLAGAIGCDPFGLLMAATLAASVGFMLPIATAPNTIVFSSGHLSTRDMARAGFWLDLGAIVLLVAAVFWLMPLAWGIRLR